MAEPPDKYRRQLNEAWSDLHQLEAIYRKVGARIDSTRQLIRATANMLPPIDRTFELQLLDIFKHPTNIAEAVRVVLYPAKYKGERLTPVQIREAAESRGFSFAEYSNPMASIHTILRRMKEAAPPEVDFNEDDGSYLLADAAPPISPHLFEQVSAKAMQRLTATGEFDRDKLEATMNELTFELFDATWSKEEREE
jgi:hypothetical protein